MKLSITILNFIILFSLLPTANAFSVDAGVTSKRLSEEQFYTQPNPYQQAPVIIFQSAPQQERSVVIDKKKKSNK